MTGRFFFFASILVLATLWQRCGQPLPPLGGPRDSLPPVVIRAVPVDSGRNVDVNRIVIEFDEYIQVQNLQQQLVVSPIPLIQPQVEGRLKLLTIRLKDSLLPNTTYSFNFGNAVQDINESNPLSNFTYVFSTGPVIDTGKLSGRILIAETGKPDSTIIAILQPEVSDTAVRTKRPKYLARPNKEGFFSFRFVAPGTYNVFALRDADGGLKYDQEYEMFGFLDQPVTITADTDPVRLNAFSEQPEKPRPVSRTTTATTPARAGGKRDDRRLRYALNLDAGTLDFTDTLKLSFTSLPTSFDSSRIYLASDTGIRLPARIYLDSNVVRIIHSWQPATKYKVFIEEGLATDAAGLTVIRNDTLRITTKKEEDYGSLTIRFQELDTTAHPILLFYSGETLKRSVPVNANRLDLRLILPGEYELRILFDSNNNGKWDTGNYDQRLQPELIKPRQQKLNIRANWDNEVDVNIREVQNQG